MSQNQKTVITLANLGSAVEVRLDPEIVFAIATEFSDNPLVQKSDELAALEAELAVAQAGVDGFRTANQRIGDLAIRKVHLEHAARAILLEKKGVKNMAELPLAIRGVVEKYRQQILALDTTYQDTCKELAEMRQKLEMSEFNAHLTAKVNIEAAISAIIKEANGG